ncbi:helix-turn-helix transcriptional regulator [Kineosporia sp. A_224]|uniref:helix-turn-helix transcriptional regulator n=1 Tax=Kineosporia sp. A_224 TaxID=1962180 RepID=UPI000B4B4C4B|nr:helix-turn-helix transcriptional regulator [Kineosporia sp. A_224]
MLIGRAAERQRIDGLVAGARVGRAGVLVVTGEAGIGKTTLLGYARDHADGVRLLAAVGSEAERDVPFGGLSQLLRPTDDDLALLPGPQAEALAVALALRAGVVGDRLAVGAAVLSLLVRWSEDRPVGVVVDDAHLLDRPSAEAIAFACRRLLADPVFVLVAARTGEEGALVTAGLPALVLGGLDRDGVAALAAGAGHPAGPERSRLLHEVTAGNPLAVLGLVHESGSSLSSALGSPAPVAVPQALTAWYSEQITALGPQTRRLLLVAAAGGADLGVLARVAAADGVDLQALAPAERAGFVTVGPARLAFAHPLVRASAYALAFPDERREVHRLVADALPAEDVDRRAWHRCEAAIGPDDALAAEMARVAATAGSRGAHAVAASASERAARLVTGAGERAEHLLSAAESAWHAGDGDRAVDLVDEAVRLPASTQVRVRALALTGDISAQRGDPARARRALLGAASTVASTDPSQAVLLLADAVSVGFFQGSAAAALDAGRRLTVLLRGDVSGAARGVGTLAVGMAQILAGRAGGEQIREGAALLDAATAAERVGIRPAWLMYGPLFLRERGAVRSLVATALDEARARSAISTLPTLLFTLARDDATTDRWDSATAHYSECAALAGELGSTTTLALAVAGQACLEARLGNADACRALAAQALELCAEYPVDIARVWAEQALAEIDLSLGEVGAARERLADLEGILTRLDLADPDVWPTPDLVEALLRAGEPDAAREAAERYAAAADLKGLPWARARAARACGLVAPGEDLDVWFTAALDLHAATPDRFEEARTRLAYGARLRRARRRVDARGQLRAALAAFERLGAQVWAATTAAELEATGEVAARRDGSAHERLTARELQVAVLLAEGRTTRQAATALFLSPKTVEYHLRHVYTKLGVTTRAGLVERLGGAGAV